MMHQITAALGQLAMPLMVSYRGQFTQGKMRQCRGEGERGGWRLNEVECMGGNLSWALAWREASLAS